MKIPFTLEAWLKDTSQEVIDENGRPVRIICTDADGLYPIIGLVDNKIPLPCGKNGRPPCIGGGGGTLFIVTPELELSEFEVKVSEFAEAYELAATDCKSEEYKTCNGNLQLIIDKYAGELLELAKKEVLKDLPRWSPNDIYPKLNGVVIGSIGTDNHFFIHRGRIIHLESLEKLPGFNE